MSHLDWQLGGHYEPYQEHIPLNYVNQISWRLNGTKKI